MLIFIRFLALFSVKILATFIFPVRTRWIGKKLTCEEWRKMRLILVLNHTSLFEWILGGLLPVSYLWQLAKRLTYPGAKETLDRRFVGRFLKWLAPEPISISRKRDDTWSLFVENIRQDSIVIFFPEGRMKRPDGLDKHGKPMTVRGGVFDIMQKFKNEQTLLVYNGGLHHVCPPGARFPRPFKKILVALEAIQVNDLLDTVKDIADETSKKFALAKHLEERRDRFCPV